MKNLIIMIFLSSFFGGCAMFSPWKAPTSCADSTKNGAACASVESNLAYSEGKDTGQSEIVIPEQKQLDTHDASVPESENDRYMPKKGESVNIPTQHANNAYREEAVIKDELSRLFAEMAIDSTVTKQPMFIPPVTYRVLIYPYSTGNKFYSSRYVYITAGRSRWVTGRIVTDGSKNILVDVPEDVVKKPVTVKEVINNITFGRSHVKNSVPEIIPTPAKQKTVKYRVSAYLLNCRDLPGIEGNPIAVFEQDRVIDIVSKSGDWWQVSFFDMTCYVNSTYLYTEPEQ